MPCEAQAHKKNMIATGWYVQFWRRAFQLEVLESPGPNYKSVKGEIAHLFILDRSLDYATCLLSPLTYESLLDEVNFLSYKATVNIRKPDRLVFKWSFLGHFLGPVFEWSVLQYLSGL